MLKAAKYAAPFCDAVDINLGCPQTIAKKGMYCFVFYTFTVNNMCTSLNGVVVPHSFSFYDVTKIVSFCVTHLKCGSTCTL